jgi:hypothetical protein
MTGLGTTSFTLPTNQFVYLEFDIVVHNTTGSVTIRKNGVQVQTASGLDTTGGTANNYCNQFSLGNQGNGNSKHIIYDDLYVLDSTDGTATQGAPLNAFLGDVRIDPLYPDGAGDSTQLTPSTGANWQCVDETPRNDDTDYVSSATTGQKDLYTLTSPTSPTGSVKAVIATMRARKDDAGTRTVHSVIKHGGVEATGADTGLSTSYAYIYDVFGQNPSTTAAWTLSDLASLQAGVGIVA